MNYVSGRTAVHIQDGARTAGHTFFHDAETGVLRMLCDPGLHLVESDWRLDEPHAHEKIKDCAACGRAPRAEVHLQDTILQNSLGIAVSNSHHFVWNTTRGTVRAACSSAGGEFHVVNAATMPVANRKRRPRCMDCAILDLAPVLNSGMPERLFATTQRIVHVHSHGEPLEVVPLPEQVQIATLRADLASERRKTASIGRLCIAMTTLARALAAGNPEALALIEASEAVAEEATHGA